MHDCEFCGNEIDYHEIIDCITCALDARDPYTAGHSERVSDMALKVCQLIGLKKEDTLKIQKNSMLRLREHTMRHLISRSRKQRKRYRMVMIRASSQRLMKMSLFRWTPHQHHSDNLKNYNTNAIGAQGSAPILRKGKTMESTMINDEIMQELITLLRENNMKREANDTFEICNYIDGLGCLLASIFKIYDVKNV